MLLVNPADPGSMISYSEMPHLAHQRALMPNLALPTLAALAPSEIEIHLHDEQLAPVDDRAHWDLVGITGYVNHRPRILDLADRFRQRGCRVAIGGPYASLCPDDVRPHADVVFVGEAEETWPQFLRDFSSGSWRSEYRAAPTVDLRHSPVPAYEKLSWRQYMLGVVQTSRGCPFECEFCDVIVYLGRKQRHKEVEQVLRELDQVRRLEFRSVFLADDNLTAYRRRCTSLMHGIERWNDAADPVTFTTQLSIDVAQDRDLLALCRRAGLKHAFIGIETANEHALREVKKRQNLLRDIVTNVHVFFEEGIAIQAGLIVGFDSDGPECFVRQYEFMQRAGIPTATVNILNAPFGTPLHRRLESQGRLKPLENYVDFDTNIVALNLSHAELVHGTHWLVNRLFAPQAFVERLRILAERLPASPAGEPEDLGGQRLERGVEAWEATAEAYSAEGSEFWSVFRTATRLFEGRDLEIGLSALMQYMHIVRSLRLRGIWDPRLALRESPRARGRRAQRAAVAARTLGDT